MERSKAIKAIQSELGLVVDGSAGSKTNEAIKKAVESGKYKLDFNFSNFKILFNRKTIDQKFVNSVNGLFQVFNEYNNEGGTNLLYVAYMLATSYHETAYRMEAIKEFGNASYFSKYGVGNLAKRLGNRNVADGIKYAGRGHVMITGRDNYQKFSTILGIDLISNPDLALNPVVSAKILVIGSLKGVFTTRKLSDYITYGSYNDFVEARRVINGVDRNRDIADYAIKFRECIIIKKV